ncbi:MAG: (deoxy)nucleoside triphosphate pyrophosphohydrolase [Clostridia bacterium]|nr:(deoxy)nucleoside triphosphate pyrophosphohydrolase [Clostridia bacterium]
MNAILVVAGIMRRDGMIFAAQRNEKAHQGLKWEFLGGKVEKGETPEQALERELFEELGIYTQTGALFSEKTHVYPEKTVRVLFYLTEIVSGEPRALEANQVGWFSKEELASLDFSGADGIVAKEICEKL